MDEAAFALDEKILSASAALTRPLAKAAHMSSMTEVARRIAPLIDRSSLETERLGTAPPRVVEALSASGLFWACLPPDLGGHDASVLDFMDAVEEIARADASSGWTLMANGIQNMFAAAYCGDEAVAQIFAPGDQGVIAGMLAPCGPAVRTGDGFWVSGSLKFGSGIGHASWVSGGALYKPEDGGEPEAICYVVRADRAAIDRDSWEAAGLAGTGSYNYAIPEQHVTEGFIYRRSGGAALRGSPTLKLGVAALGASGHCAVALGIAERAMEELVRIIDTGRQRPGQVLARDQQLFRHDFAVHDGALRASRAYAWQVYGEAIAALETAKAPTAEQEQRIRQAVTLATEAAHRTTTFAYRWAGTSALKRDHPISRCMRDILGAVQHISVDPNSLANAAPALMAAYRR